MICAAENMILFAVSTDLFTNVVSLSNSNLAKYGRSLIPSNSAVTILCLFSKATLGLILHQYFTAILSLGGL